MSLLEDIMEILRKEYGIRRVADELELLSQDKRVVDVIYAVNDVRGGN